MKKVKYLVLGAGISGLSFVDNIESDDYVIIEKENEPGGLCRTHKVKGFIWDYAGHFFHFQNEKTKEYFKTVLDDKKCVKQNKNTKIFYNGNYIDYPFQKNIHQLRKEDFIDCLYHLFFREEKIEYNSFKDMLMGKFGRGICDRFLIPYNEKLYACDLNLLDQDAMGRFFPYANLSDIIKNMKENINDSYNGTFIYPFDGAHVVIDYLMKNVDTKKLMLNEEVRFINLDEKIVTTNKTQYKYEYLINTIPFNIFSNLCSIKISDLSWNKVLVFNIGFDSPPEDVSIHWLYYPEKKYNFYRVGFYNNILLQNKMSLYVEIGFSQNALISLEEEYKKTIENLRKCGIIKKHKVEAYEALIIDPAYVHISEKSKNEVTTILNILKNENVFSIGRYGEWTYCSMEDCYINAKNLASRIRE